MVAGQQWPGGDPFLRQQNEPSLAVSTRNPMHLLAAANDYRSVDIPFNAPPRPDDEQTGDAWIGIFKSLDGGNRWFSTLLDGYPQLLNSTSPLKGFQAGADPVVRAGNSGMFYVAGIVTNRGANPLGGVWVARFIDNNNRENGDPIAYIDTKMIATGTTGQFIDKPWLAVDPKPNGLQCTVSGQTFAAQNIYLAYTIFVGGDNNIRTKMMFVRSQNCGATWQPATKLSETFPVNQGVVIAPDPTSNNVYVAWRQFAAGNDPNAIILAKSTDGGATFPKATLIKTITPFEQGTGNYNIRTNAYPAMAVDNTGRVYIAWSERIPQQPTPWDATPTDGRIVMINSQDGAAWTTPAQVNNISPDRGHQFMPTMSFVAGKLTIAWYDLRLDSTVGTYIPNNNGFYTEVRTAAGNLAQFQPQVVFWNFMADFSPFSDPTLKLIRRHTLEVFAGESTGGLMPAFTVARVTRYKFGSAPNSKVIQDLQINPPNLPMFAQGTVPFFGDYIDLAAYQPNGSTTPSRVRHIVWTDNRDVRPPIGNPPNWAKYTPVNSSSLGQKSLFDPSQNVIPCADPSVDATGSRNQNIYAVRVTDGLFAGAPGNAKQLNIARAFTVFVQNARDTIAAYRLTAQQPSPATASFVQTGPVIPSVDLSIPPHSTMTRTVFVSQGAPLHAKIDVSVVEITTPGGNPVPNGLSSTVTLNPDIGNPDIGNPDIGNPDIGNTEVFNPDIGNPDIGNPDIGNPDIGNPDIGNPDIGNPDIGNPDIGNPDIGNPDIGNPDIGNPDIGNPDIGNGSVTDTTWDTSNGGNTTGGYSVKLAQTAPLPGNLKTQLILSKLYDTPIARDCNLGVEHNRQVVSTKNNPTFTNVNDGDPSLTDPNTPAIWLAPHETGYITVRLIDPVNKGLTLDASQYITPLVISQATNSGESAPRVALGISPGRIPDFVFNTDVTYFAQLQAIGGIGTKTFSGGAGLPSGVTLSSTGLVSGHPATVGSFPFTATVTDSRQSKTATILFNVVSRLGITTEFLPNGNVGTPYTAQMQRGGGVAPFVWSITDGSLPDGLTMSPTGLISGTPTTGGISSFTVKVTDTTFPDAQAAFGQFSIQIIAPMFLFFDVQPASGIEGSPLPRVAVHAEDATGARLPGVQITLNFGQSPCGETQPDQTALTNSDGVAVFGSVPHPNACYDYTLLATGAAAGFSQAVRESNKFDSFGFGRFQPTITEHPFGATTKLNDGRILVTGGQPTTPTNAAEAWTPSAFKWIALPNMNVSRSLHTSTLLADGRVLITGGRSGGTVTNSIEFFDPATNTFTVNPTGLNVARFDAKAVRMSNGSVAIIGGADTAQAPLDSIEIVAPDGTVTLSSATLRQPRSFHQIITLANGNIAVIGDTTTDVDLFDGSAVTNGGSVLVASLGPTLTTLANGTIFIVDGNVFTPDGVLAAQSAEIYDPTNGTATSLGPTLYEQTGNGSARLADGTVIIAGGQTTPAPGVGAATDAVELFDPSTNTFIDYGKIEAPTEMPGIVPYDGIPNSFLLISSLGGGRVVSVFYPAR